MKGINYCVKMSAKDEAVKRAVALSNYADKYIRDNQLLEEYTCDQITELRTKIYSARMDDYKDYPSLMEIDYNLLP